jgi:hypothetical protein
VPPQPIITEPIALAAAFARACRNLAAHDPGVDVLLAELAIGRTARARAHLRADNVEPRVAARYCAWTGDVATILAVWPALRERAQAIMRDPLAPGRARLCSELQPAATDVGDAAFAAELHRCARTATDVTTPVANDDARIVLDTVHAVIGAEPDAVRARLRLRPRLPAGEHRLHVRQLVFADGDVSLRLEGAAASLHCVVEQDAGALPFTVLLEPYVTAAVAATRIDGLPAQLDTRDVADGRIIQVQLVLEQERALDIDFVQQ